MKKSLLILSLVLLSLSAWATKIYINPGHGSWSANCRHMGLINVPVGAADANGYYSGNDTLGFFESNTNLWKALFLEKKLLEKGYQVKMSRRYSGGTNELESSAYDKALHVIGAESQAYGSDYFISIHSNAHIDGYTTNYPVFIHKGYDNAETNAGSIWGEKILWDHHFKIFSSGMEPYSYYSATNKCIRGGLSMNGWDYGVLRTQDRPGTLVEGYFHTYQPARHRAMNTDWCRQEGLRYFRGFTEMYGTAKDTKGYIMGYVRTKDKQINQTNYTGRAGNDIYYPLNGAKIVLRNASGQIIKTDNYKYVARDVNNQNKSYYTTDNYYNGVFVFDDLTPGTYTISVHCAGYADVKQTLTVTAHETTYTQVFMTAGTGTEPDVNEIQGTSGLNPYAYDLSSSWDETNQKLTVKFSLNADAYVDGAGGYADGVQIYLSDDKADPKKYYVYGLSKAECKQGQNKSFTIDLSSGVDKNGKKLPKGKVLYASVTVQGDRSNTAPREYSLSHRVKYPNGIAVDKNPDSKNFGKIFVNEAYQYAQGGELTEYFTKGLAGMYVLDADFQVRNNTRYTGGYDFSWWVIDNTYSGLARKGYQPWCVRVSEEGRIFICSNDMHQRQTTLNANGERDGVAVWEVDRNNFNNWTPVLKGYRRFVSGQTGTNYTFSYKDVNGVEQFIGPICGMDVKGTGDDVTLLLYTVNQAGVWLDMNGFRAYEYNVKTGALKPVPAFNNGGYGLVFEYTSLRYGVDGSYWFGGSRADGSDGVEGNGKTKEPNLGHVKLDGTTADYTNYNSEFYGGAGMVIYKSTYNNSACNAANQTWLVTGKDNSAGSDGLFDVFIVNSTDGGGAGVTRMDGNSGRPNWQKITASGMGRNLNDMAVDYAENLYIVSSSGGMVRAYAMPYCGEKTTTARSEYGFKLPGNSMEWHPYPAGYKVTNQDLLDQFVEDTVGNDLATLLTGAESAWKWLGDYILTVDANVAANGTWAAAVEDFFAAQNAFATAGQPAQWEKKWWDATFKDDLKTGDIMPNVKRHGWVLEDWRYGNKDGYYYFSEESKVKNNAFDESKVDSAHIWVRWVEACLYEGYETYIHSGDTSAIDLRAWAINTNEDLLTLTDGKTMDVSVKRTFNTGVYNTLALPFTVTRELFRQVTDEAGNHIFDPAQGGKTPKIYVYDQADVVMVDSVAELQLHVHTLKSGEQLAANTPFLIVPQDTIVGKLNFKNVTLVKENSSSVESGVQFIGLASPEAIDIAEGTKVHVLAADGTVAELTEKTTLLGSTGYFVTDSTVAAYDTVTIVSSILMTWRPYPVGYEVSNQDLLDQFVEDTVGVADVATLLTEAESSWKWLGDYIQSVDTSVVTNGTWDAAVADFFAAQNAFETAGQPAQWEKKWWDANFTNSVHEGDAMPKVKRHGWVLENWRYGNEDGYYYFSEASKVKNDAFDAAYADSTHIWARWIEKCLYEGYETYAESGDTSAIDLRTWVLTANEDLLTLISGTTTDVAIKRTLQKDVYNSLYLPFDLSKAMLSQWKDIEGNPAFDTMPVVYVYEADTVVLVDEKKELQLLFHELADDEVIKAGVPFLIQPKEDVAEKIYIESVYVTKGEALEVADGETTWVGEWQPENVSVSEEYHALLVAGGDTLLSLTETTQVLALSAYAKVPASVVYDYAVIKLPSEVLPEEPQPTIVWHPYPIGYEVSNLDLWEQFAEDTIGKSLVDMLTDAESTWKWLGEYIQTVDTTVADATAWEQSISDFFHAENAFATAGQPASWDSLWWNATFADTLAHGATMPNVKRHGWVLEGWRYGNEDGYYYLSEESHVLNNQYDTLKRDSTHLWCRWLEKRVSEGYDTYTETADTSAIDLREWIVNTNADLVELLDGKMVDLTVTRTLIGDGYNAISLPFAVTEETIKQVTDAEGNLLFDVEQGGQEPTIYLYDLANVVVTNEGDSELQIQLHALKEGETIAAHQPFVIKPQADVELNMVFHDVTIVKPEEVVLGVDDVQFLPQFVPGTVSPQDGNTLITISGLSEILEEHTEAVSISGLSGYFVVTPACAAYDYAVIQEKDGVTTGIHDINTSEKPIKVMIDNQVYILYGGNMYSIIGNR